MTSDPVMADLSRHDAEEARRESFMPSHDAALDDLLGKLMDGEEYPRRATRNQINLLDILGEQVDADEVASYLCAFVHGSDDAQDRAIRDIKKIVRDYLEGDGRGWVDMRVQEMAEEREEER